MPNEAEKFLEDLKTNETPVDLLEAPLNPQAPETAVEEPEEEKEEEIAGIRPRNRKERRRLERLEADRNTAIELAEKLATREDARRAVSEESDYLKGLDQLYGTDSPEKILATDILKKAIVGAREDAKAQAIAELREERKRERDEEEKATRQLDRVIEDIEDTYDVELTDAQEQAYFSLLQQMSPKDQNGNVTALADSHAVWDIFKDRLAKKTTDNRAKNLSSRSMVQSGASTESTLQLDTGARALHEAGII